MVKEYLRAKARLWLGIDLNQNLINSLSRRIDSLERDVDALLDHTGVDTGSIRGRRIAAASIVADKIPAGAITPFMYGGASDET